MQITPDQPRDSRATIGPVALILVLVGLVFLCDAVTGLIGILPDWPVFARTLKVSSPVCGQWEVQPSPKIRFLQELDTVSSLGVVDRNDAWIVGSTNAWTDNTLPELMSLHWNGYRWSNVDMSERRADIISHLGVNNIAAIGPNDIWSVASGYSNGQDLIRHWDGQRWSVSPSPVLAAKNNHLYGLAVVNENDVWAVGHADIPNISWGIGSVMHTAIAEEAKTLIIHWDGKSWSEITAPEVGGLNAVAAVSVDDIWAVGSGILHWDGKAWHKAISPNAILHDVAVVNKSDVWAVGAYNRRTVTIHWDGEGWKEVPNPDPPPNANYLEPHVNRLNALVALSADDVWAVGSQFGSVPDPQSPYRNLLYTVVEHWDGKGWSIVPSPNFSRMQDFVDIAAISEDELWAVGAEGDSDSVLIARFTRSNCP